MPRITPERREAQRQRIVDAAREAMQRDGLQATSMARVIEVSGLSAGAIYGYFASKDELVLAVALDVISTRLDGMRELAEQRPVPPPAEALGTFIEGLPHGTEGALVLEIWATAARSRGLGERAHKVFGEVGQGALEYLTAWYALEQGLPHDAATERARRTLPALLGLAQGWIVQSTVLERLTTADYRAAITALLHDDAYPEPGRDTAHSSTTPEDDRA
ncbi:TetR/AcrR family transcriptional regulator [Kytococcus sp. Marseille-QA3725]